MGKLGDTANIRTDTVVSRIVYQYSFCVRIGKNGTFHRFHRHAQRNSQILVFVRIHINGNSPVDNQCVDRTAVHIAGHDQLFTGFADRHNHSLRSTGSTVDDKKGIGSPERFRGKLLCIAEHGNRMTEIVQIFHRIHVNLYASLSEKIRQFMVAPSALVSGNVKPYHTVHQMLFQSVHQRSVLLCPVHIALPPQ